MWAIRGIYNEPILNVVHSLNFYKLRLFQTITIPIHYACTGKSFGDDDTYADFSPVPHGSFNTIRSHLEVSKSRALPIPSPSLLSR